MKGTRSQIKLEQKKKTNNGKKNHPNNPVHILKQHKLTNSSTNACITAGLEWALSIIVCISGSIGTSLHKVLNSFTKKIKAENKIKK